MIIYGVRSTQLAKEIITDKCSGCGTQNSTELYVFQKYAHVFWIPLFPVGKTVVSECHHCKQVLKQKEMPSALISSYEKIKSQTKTPVWTFAGLAVFAVILLLDLSTTRKNDKENAQYILAPKSGDILEIKTKENQYTVYKIDEVQGDSVLIRINEYETNKLSGLGELKAKGEKSFSDETFSFSKAELKTMLEKGEIIDIERN